MKNKCLHFRKSDLVYLLLFVYFVVLSSFRLNYGIDSQLGKIILGLLIFFFLTGFKKITINNMTIWLFLFWGWYYLSMLWTSNISDTSFYFMSSIKVIILSIIISTIIKTKDDVNKIISIVLLSLIISSIVLFIKTPITVWGTSRVGYAIGLNPNDLGLRYCFGVIICLYFLDINKNSSFVFPQKIKSLLIFLIITAFTLIILFSGSKKALFCLIFGFIFYVTVSTKGLKKYLKIVLLIIATIMLWNIIINNSTFYNVIGSRVEDFINYTFYNKTSKYDISSVEREYFRKEAFNLFKNNWLIGSGGNGFVTYMRNVGHNHIAYSHNNYLELLCTLGVIGFSIFYSFIGKLIYALYKNIKENKLFILFLSLIFCMLISDYGGVSYFEQFNMIIITVINSYIIVDRKTRA